MEYVVTNCTFSNGTVLPVQKLLVIMSQPVVVQAVNSSVVVLFKMFKSNWYYDTHR